MTLSDLYRRIAGLIVKGRGLGSRQGAHLLMDATLREGEVRSDIPVLERYGLTARPRPGGRILAACMGGAREMLEIWCAQDPYRPQDGEEGSVILYSYEDEAAPHRIHLRPGARIEIIGQTVAVTARGDATVTAAGNATITAGDVARLDGNHVEIHAAETLRMDVNGYGETWEWDADAEVYRVHTRMIGPVEAGTTGPVEPPEHEV